MTSTSNFGFYLPLVNNATDQDLWGGELNTDLTEIDTVLDVALNWTPSAQTTTITVTAPTAGSTTTGSAKTLYLCNATSGAFAANLPAVATATGMTVAFQKTDSSANAITITGHSADTINGVNMLVLSAQYSYAVLVCDGTNWDILAQTPPVLSVFSSAAAGVVPASPVGTGSTINSGGTWLGANEYTSLTSSPTGNTNNAGLMTGLAGSITPASTGVIFFSVSGYLTNSNSNAGSVQLRYGTGTAPSNGGALTGTVVGYAGAATSSSEPPAGGFSIQGVITGLTVGTTYWIDISTALNGGSGTMAANQVRLSAFEVK